MSHSDPRGRWTLEGRAVTLTAPAAFVDHPSRVPVDRSRYVWRPSPELAEHLPEEFSLSMDCTATRDGARRLAPITSAGDFLVQARLGGHAALVCFGCLDRAQRSDDNVMFLIHSRARHLRARLGRNFTCCSDLCVRAVARLAFDETDVLPEDLGLDDLGSGQRWGLRDLLERGREAARRAGLKDPTPQEVITFGLTEAARESPLRVEPSETPAIVRAALFDLGAGDARVTPEQQAFVTEQVVTSLEDHLCDSREEFRRWIEDPKGDLVHRIVKKQGCPGGPLSRDQVHRALVELAWQSYRYSARSIDAMMQVFRNALPEPLSKPNQKTFELFYLAQPCFGGLPLVMLHERFRFLRVALMDILDAPEDPEPKAVLYRMLWFYAQMVETRRRCDRQAKQYQQRSLEAQDERRGINRPAEEDSEDDFDF